MGCYFQVVFHSHIPFDVSVIPVFEWEILTDIIIDLWFFDSLWCSLFFWSNRSDHPASFWSELFCVEFVRRTLSKPLENGSLWKIICISYWLSLEWQIYIWLKINETPFSSYDLTSWSTLKTFQEKGSEKNIN